MDAKDPKRAKSRFFQTEFQTYIFSERVSLQQAGARTPARQETQAETQADSEL